MLLLTSNLDDPPIVWKSFQSEFLLHNPDCMVVGHAAMRPGTITLKTIGLPFYVCAGRGMSLPFRTDMEDHLIY